MKNAFLLSGLILISNITNAANIWCSGTISDVYIDRNDNLVIKGSWRNANTRLCATDGSADVSTVTCSIWYSLVASSMTNNKTVTLQYSDQGGTMDCSNIPTYSDAPAPFYVNLNR
jgi:hypothetical protein